MAAASASPRNQAEGHGSGSGAESGVGVGSGAEEAAAVSLHLFLQDGQTVVRMTLLSSPIVSSISDQVRLRGKGVEGGTTWNIKSNVSPHSLYSIIVPKKLLVTSKALHLLGAIHFFMFEKNV